MGFYGPDSQVTRNRKQKNNGHKIILQFGPYQCHIDSMRSINKSTEINN
jgi:hypothetical protein